MDYDKTWWQDVVMGQGRTHYIDRVVFNISTVFPEIMDLDGGGEIKVKFKEAKSLSVWNLVQLD